MTRMKHDRQVTREQRAAERCAALSRRRFLKGVGACIALPALPTLAPLRALGAEAAVAGAAAAPLRMAFITFPNGCNLDKWWPTGDGADFKFNQTMQSLASVKQYVQVISGLDDNTRIVSSVGEQGVVAGAEAAER